jgi:putative nucleotidyltransferase with HDIG domain
MKSLTSRIVDRYLTAKLLSAATAEKEAEKLLLELIKDSPFRGRVFSVGGYVRDEYMGLEAKDLDIVVSIPGGSEKLTRYLHNMFPSATTTPYQMGATYPIWQITFTHDITYEKQVFNTKGAVIEFADTMKEEFPDATSRQRVVVPTDLKGDIERRDFTVNMLLKDLSTGELVDLTGTSKNDIKKGILRGHPRVSLDKIFSEDPLRLIRLIRFQCKYNWKIPLSVIKTVRRNAHRIEIVSAERVMGELTKVMKLGKLDQAIRLMKTTGLLKYVLPEVEAMIGVQQGEKYHREGDVYRHTLLVLRNAPHTIEGQLAALLHDVGKPSSQKVIEDAVTFHGHEDVGAEIAKAILYRLKFDAVTIKKVVAMVRNHMRPHFLTDASEKAIRKLVRDLGEELVTALLDLAEADEKAAIPVRQNIQKLRERVKSVRESPLPVSQKPVLNGNEIMDTLGITPRDKRNLPLVGQAGRFLLELADEYAEQGRELTKEQASQAVRKQFENKVK